MLIILIFFILLQLKKVHAKANKYIRLKYPAVYFFQPQQTISLKKI
jgi:hypothetical protein